MRAHDGFFSARDGFAEARNAEAAFFARLFALFVDDLGIDEDDFLRLRVACFGLFAAGNIDHGETAGDGDLRGGETHAVGGVHGFEHVCDELMQFGRIELCDEIGGAFEDGVVQVTDHFMQHLETLHLGLVAIVISFGLAK